jgi:hypothetical protein
LKRLDDRTKKAKFALAKIQETERQTALAQKKKVEALA